MFLWAAQVAWQALREDVDLGGAAPQAGGQAHPAAVGAVLTSQRLLLVSPQLRVLVAAPPSPGITSFLWLGPALLYATTDHQVRAAGCNSLDPRCCHSLLTPVHRLILIIMKRRIAPK